MIDYGGTLPDQTNQDFQDQLAKKRFDAQQTANYQAARQPTAFPQAPVSADQQGYMSSLATERQQAKPAIQNAFELIGRPEAAVRGAIQAGVGGEFQGGDVAGGFMTGLSGGNVPGYSEMPGVRDLPGPLPQITEKVGSTVLDPLNLIPVSRAVTGAKAAYGAVKAATAGGMAISALSKAPGWVSVGDALVSGTRNTPLSVVGAAMSKAAADKPVVGGIMAGLVPRIGEMGSDEGKQLAQLMTAFGGSDASAATVGDQVAALLTQGNRMEIARDASGRVRVPGFVDPIAEGDLAANPSLYHDALSAAAPSQAEVYARARQMFAEDGPLMKHQRALNDQVREVYGDKVADDLAIPPTPAGTEAFIPRQQVAIEGQRPASGMLTGVKRSMQQEREFPTEELGIQNGMKYQPVVDAAAQRATDIAHNMSAMDLLLQPTFQKYVKAVGEAAYDEGLTVRRGNTPAARMIGGEVAQGAVFPTVTEYSAVGNEAQSLKPLLEQGFGRDIWLDPAIADLMRGRLQREESFRNAGGTTPVLGPLGGINTALRSLMATGDLSAFFLHNLPMLATDPARGMASMYLGVRAMFSPGMYEKMMASEWAQNVLEKAPTILTGQSGNLADVAAREAGVNGPFAGTLGSALGKASEVTGNVPGVGGALGLAGAGASQVVSRTSAGWNMALDFSRLAAADAMLPMTKNASEVAALADYLNHATGTISSRAMGIDPMQRGIESFLSFAPRFFRGSLALIGDVAGGRIAGPAAINALASMLVSGTAMYAAVARDIGQQPELDPRRAAFLTVGVGDQRIGIGGVYRSLLQALGHIQAQIEGKETMALGEWSMQNPLVHLARSRLGPAPGTIWDVIDGKDFIGTPVLGPGSNPWSYAGSRLFPFALGAFVQEHGIPSTPEELGQSAIAGAAKGLGFRDFPLPRQDVLDSVARQQFGKDYNDLPVTQQTQVRASDQAQALPPSNQPPDQERDKIFKDYTTQVGGLAGRLNGSGQDALDAKQFRNELTKARDARDVLLQNVDQRYPGSVKPPTTLEGKAYLEYRNLSTTPDSTGMVDHEAADTYLSELPAATQAYIKEKLQAGTEMLPAGARGIVQGLDVAREQLKPYWDVFKTDMQAAGLWDQWNNASPAEQDAMKQSRQMQIVAQKIKLDRDRMRRSDPAIDALLVKWGYVNKGINDFAPKPVIAAPNEPARTPASAPTAPAAPATSGEIGGALRVVKDAVGRIIGLQVVKD